VVTGSTNVGGLIGYCTISDIITACFWDTQTSGQDISAGGNGKTTAEMKAQSTYIEAGWKFMADADTYHEGEYWFSSNSGYPVHAWGVIQTVNTLKATDITESTATLNGRLYANGYATTVEFEWGTTDTYGNTVVIGSYGAKDYLDLSTTLSELTKNTLYHYRIKATHTQGSEVKTSYGIDMIIYTGAPATAPDAGNGSSGNPYQIATLANLRWLSENSDKWASGKYFIQTTDIDASETQYWDNGEGFSPIGESSIRFQGNYDGNGHTISGIYINRSSTYFIGLFGFIYTGANIRNLGLIDAEIIGCYFIGSLIGCNREASVSNCYASGTVSGGNSVGGLIGHILGGSVSNCYASGSVSGVSTVDGLLGSSVGGLIGSNDYASVSNCYASGAVSGESSVGGLIGRNYLTTVLNCYASGAVSGEYSVGGLIGSLSGTISACFWDNTVNSGLDGVGYGYSGDQVTGETTTKMQTKSIYTDAGWDFLTVWGINDTINEGYPHLYWQSPLPRIIIGSIEDITIGSVDIYGDLFYAGSSYPLQHGFCWNTEGEPSLEDDFIELGPVPSTGVFRAQITGLTSNTLYYIRAYATNEAETVYSQVISFTTLKTGIVEGIPSNYVLSQNYPNPFNPTTTLQYGLPEASDVDLMIFDITGRKIKSWHISSQQAGWHKVIWNGTNQYDQQISTGVYIYSLRAGDFVDTKKMVFMK
jgi:flagellar hook assembly protein FlgD